jgi:hypothetical protein
MITRIAKIPVFKLYADSFMSIVNSPLLVARCVLLLKIYMKLSPSVHKFDDVFIQTSVEQLEAERLSLGE